MRNPLLSNQCFTSLTVGRPSRYQTGNRVRIPRVVGRGANSFQVSRFPSPLKKKPPHLLSCRSRGVLAHRSLMPVSTRSPDTELRSMCFSPAIECLRRSLRGNELTGNFSLVSADRESCVRLGRGTLHPRGVTRYERVARVHESKSRLRKRLMRNIGMLRAQQKRDLGSF